MNLIKQLLYEQCNLKVDLLEKKPEVWQILIPFCHADGEMIEVFICPKDDNSFRISDCGFTIKHLSRTADLNSLDKEYIFNKIISSYNIQNDNGNLYIDVDAKHLCYALFQFIGAILKLNDRL